ncbi:MAG TPA: PEPxxWA-CTERM sorting domain-containing protein [Phenylobacterium sp.]
MTYDLRASFAFYGLGVEDMHFTYVSPDFIVANRAVPGADLSACAAPIYPPDCDVPVNFVFFETVEFVGLGLYQPPPGVILTFDFAPGSLGHAGVYDAISWPDVARLTVTSSGAPEPESWALMIVGFGAIGAAMRRRTSRRRAIHP